MESAFYDKCILIAGLGLIGGSFARGLSAHGFSEVYAFDRNIDTLKAAKQDGVIKDGFSEFSKDTPVFDFVLCCLSPAHVAPLYDDVAPYLHKNSVFAEVGGIKTVMIAALNTIMKPSHQLLSLHPMAGTEKTGYTHSDSAMFAGSVLIMIPTSKTGRAALGWAKVLELIMDFKHTLQLSADEHDQIIAHVSHIPHVAALAIKAMYPGSGNERFAGRSYKAITRVAEIDAGMWACLMTDNREHLLEGIGEFKSQLSRLEKAIAQDDQDALQSVLNQMSKGK